MSNWFITGISRGFGKTLTEELLAQGHNVVGTTREGTSEITHDNLTVVKLDVTDAAAVSTAVDAAVAKLSTLDVVVNNAGFGIVGAVEEVTRDEIDKVMETNFYGTFNVLQAVLPTLRKQGKGKIFNFSSVTGIATRAGFGAYAATKFAVEGLSEALYGELKPLGINVTIVEPGVFRTDFLTGHSLLRAAKQIDAYNDTAGAMRGFADNNSGKQPGDPQKAAEIIIKVSESNDPPLRLPLGQDAHERIRTKLAQVETDIKAWEKYSANTAFEEKSAA
jgi:NAD(P)-dependent dehydrogenase (short-subunit alcohol dehydrogenase family)